MESLGFLLVACAVIAFALVSRRLQGTVLTPPLLFAVFGLVIGGAGFEVIEVDFDLGLIHTIAEVTLILVLFSDAARIELRTLRSEHNLPVRMLVFGLPLAIFFGALAALGLPLGFGVWEAALLAAILAPTDAALGQAVVTSPHVPVRIRQALNVESGLNDGIALPAVLLFAALASTESQINGTTDWVVFAAKQLTLGPLAGVVIGGAGAWLIDRAVQRGWVSENYEGGAILAMAFLSFGGAEAIGGNGFIAAFVAGLVFGNVVRSRCDFVFEFLEAEGQILVLITFLIFGAVIVPELSVSLGWAEMVYVVLSLTLIRMVPIVLSLFGTGVRPDTCLFLAWFGPRGLASILFALLILEETSVPAAGSIVGIVIAVVGISIVVHGMSAAPAARRYGKAMSAESNSEEMRTVMEFPMRGQMMAKRDSAPERN